MDLQDSDLEARVRNACFHAIDVLDDDLGHADPDVRRGAAGMILAFRDRLQRVDMDPMGFLHLITGPENEEPEEIKVDD